VLLKSNQLSLKSLHKQDIDEVILGHTNEPEYRKLQSNEFMEALRDRTVKIDVPYITRLDQEVRIYQKDFNENYSSHAHCSSYS
jgi:serine protein kinase